ncbi:MAG: protease modulator HflK [Sedimentisphaerales bacterium]|nr:protease modulator HflK [Sedimentisphaerales bacterium]
MTEQENKEQQNKDQIQANPPQDLASKFLSDALRASFILLQIIMAVIALVFIISGWREIGADEKGIVLQFGKIRGQGDKRILKSGGHWIWPYPIEELVRIPVAKKVNLVLDELWYEERKLPDSPKTRPNFGPTINPLREGYSLTRSEKQKLTDSPESDYNIVHTMWQLTYQIENPELFFKNVFIDWESIQPGQNYSDVLIENITPILKDIFADSVISTIVNFTIDDVLYDKIAIITERVERRLQQKLDNIECGIRVVSVQLEDKAPPRQVNAAFQKLIQSINIRETEISKAEAEADKTKNEAEGQSAEKIANANAFKRQIVESAQANAEFFNQLLPEYRKRPKLVVQERYRQAIKSILENVDEKMIIQPTGSARGSEIRIELNRDPTIKKKTEEDKSKGNKQ